MMMRLSSSGIKLKRKGGSPWPIRPKSRNSKKCSREKVAMAEQYNSRYLDEVRKSEVNAK
jgi:hypothetical protein